MTGTSSRLMFLNGFLLSPPSGWRVQWADDVEGTLVHLDPVAGRPHRVWRLTGRREYQGGEILYEGMWPD